MATSARNERRDRFTLVVGLKLDDAGGYAVEEAVKIAQRIPNCALHLVHIMNGAPDPETVRDRAGHLRLYANEKIASLGGFRDFRLRVHVRAGDAAALLGRFAREHGADLIVLGPEHRHGLTSWFGASFADRLASATECNVVLAMPKPHVAPDRRMHEPVIEPPCHACVEARFASKGGTWWCAQHDHHGQHARGSMRAHAYSYQRELPLRSPDRQVFLA